MGRVRWIQSILQTASCAFIDETLCRIRSGLRASYSSRSGRITAGNLLKTCMPPSTALFHLVWTSQLNMRKWIECCKCPASMVVPFNTLEHQTQWQQECSLVTWNCNGSSPPDYLRKTLGTGCRKPSCQAAQLMRKYLGGILSSSSIFHSRNHHHSPSPKTHG